MLTQKGGKMSDLISRQAAIEHFIALWECIDEIMDKEEWEDVCKTTANEIPSAQPERLTDDDFETIRIHLNAYKEKLCNQQRWEEAEEYQRIIDRFMAFASAQPDRDIPLKPIETTDKAWGIPSRQAVCPKCDYYLGHIAFLGDYKGKRITYCETCGQAINWEGWEWDE